MIQIGLAIRIVANDSADRVVLQTGSDYGFATVSPWSLVDTVRVTVHVLTGVMR